MSSKEDENFSLLLNSTLDNYGFNEEIITFRSYCFNKLAGSLNTKSDNWFYPLKVSMVGSGGEGFRFKSSDIDLLIVFINTICMDKPTVNPNLTILKTDYTNTAPGYTKMVLIKKSSYDIRHPFHFETNYISSKGHPYIPSAVLEYFVKNIQINGPALALKCSYVQCKFLMPDIDWVYSVFFIGSKHLSKWARRSRPYSWPSCTVLNEISTMEGFIVPVGDKQSDLQSLEWRICFTTAEKKLVENLNTPAKKLYIVLKMVSKSILKPVCKEITSYVVKNVVFWIAEGMPEQQCSVKYLVAYLLKSLFFIKQCLVNNHLPNYMIPERNLLRSVCGSEKQAAIDFLSRLLNEGRTIIYRIPKLSKCMSYMKNSPERALMYGKWRDEVERLTMEFIVGCFEIQNKNPFKIWLAIIRKKNLMKVLKYIMLVVPEFTQMVLQGRFEEICNLLLTRSESTMLL